MSFIGYIPYFSTYSSNFDTFVEKTNQFFEINDDIDERKKSYLLLNSVEDQIYQILCNRTYPYSPHEKPYTELLEILRQHYYIKTSVFRERIKFYNAIQKKHETILVWYGRVNELSAKCNFHQNFDAIILDRFVCGILCSEISDRLMEEDESLTLNRALQIAVEMEMAINSRTTEKKIQKKKGKAKKKKGKQLEDNCSDGTVENVSIL